MGHAELEKRPQPSPCYHRADRRYSRTLICVEIAAEVRNPGHGTHITLSPGIGKASDLPLRPARAAACRLQSLIRIIVGADCGVQLRAEPAAMLALAYAAGPPRLCVRMSPKLNGALEKAARLRTGRRPSQACEPSGATPVDRRLQVRNLRDVKGLGRRLSRSHIGCRNLLGGLECPNLTTFAG